MPLRPIPVAVLVKMAALMGRQDLKDAAVLAGSLTVSRLHLPFLPATIIKVSVGDHAVVATRHGDWFEPAEPIRLEAGEAITAS